MPLIDAIGPARVLAFVGLAKNTGKTTALTGVIRQADARGERLGVTSVGRDGEAFDVLDHKIRKPAVHLPAGSLVATTDHLLRASPVAYRIVDRPGHRTAMGEVVVARTTEPGPIEVAGPSTGLGSREVAEVMLGHGCDRVLIDGSIDRRATASAAVADGVVLATGAVLGPDAETVARRTRDAVRLFRLPLLDDARVRAAALASAGSVLLTGTHRPVAIGKPAMLGDDEAALRGLFSQYPDAFGVLVRGPLCRGFTDGLLRAREARGQTGAADTDAMTVVVEDATDVFLSGREIAACARRGVRLVALRRAELLALVVNPTAPPTHCIPDLVAHIRAAVPDVPVFDVVEAGSAAAS